MFDQDGERIISQLMWAEAKPAPPHRYLAVKRCIDISVSLFLLPLLIVTGCLLLLLNPVLNRGPLLFVQLRMGQHCKPFPAIKFRSMRPPSSKARRSPECPLEHDRITPLGSFLRKARLDELPQILNVLKGDMSLIGPRPDYVHHARKYLRAIPGYRQRHVVRPGISGLAQTVQGYAEGMDATRRKVALDLHYIESFGPRVDARVFLHTLKIVFGLRGI